MSAPRTEGPGADGGGAAALVDGAAVAMVGAAVLVVADRPAVMWAVLLVALVARFVLWRRLHPERSLAVELVFFAVCAVVGAFNDLNTVALHGVYRYTAPSELPALSPIPLWMLLYWGLILRFVLALTRWHGLGAPRPRRVLGRRSIPRLLALVAAVIVPTRLVLFARYEDALWSWLPFAVALGVFAVVGRVDRHDLRLAALALVVGPVVEALFIRVGHLHAYALGWLFGVPLWIVLWWALSVWIWKDVGALAHAGIERALGRLRARRVSTA
ncbi:MAG: hypothetical protein KC619_18000 [Myxococcales bacterium]|nr:hypothetical protein [Myxococcales bacterium]